MAPATGGGSFPYGSALGSISFWSRILSRVSNTKIRIFNRLQHFFVNTAKCPLFYLSSNTVAWLLAAVRLFIPESDSIGGMINTLPVGLPAGISFYTFESLSFVIDVYRRDVDSPRNPLDFFSFIGMFPRFIAGPIVRYKDMVGQFSSYQGMAIEKGLCIFAIGLFLKSCFADNFSEFVGYAFDRADVPDFATAWIGAFSYAMQLYFDFSGYSLMALGLGKCFGFQFPINFNRPYLAKSLRDFWNRWHISLSQWVRDYLFYPLALYSARLGKLALCFSLFVTMVVIGLWHGPKVTYLIMGAWFGFWLVIEHLAKLHTRLNYLLHSALTFFLVIVGWVFFRSESLANAKRVLLGMSAMASEPGHFNYDLVYSHPVALVCAFAGVIYCFLIERNFELVTWIDKVDVTWLHRITATALVVFSVKVDTVSTVIPFIYFQF